MSPYALFIVQPDTKVNNQTSSTLSAGKGGTATALLVLGGTALTGTLAGCTCWVCLRSCCCSKWACWVCCNSWARSCCVSICCCCCCCPCCWPTTCKTTYMTPFTINRHRLTTSRHYYTSTTFITLGRKAMLTITADMPLYWV